MIAIAPAPAAAAGRPAVHDRRGAAATELAVLLPLLITLCLIGVDFGRYAYFAIVVANAARVGADRGATRGHTDATFDAWRADVVNAASEELSGMPGEVPTIRVESEPAEFGLRRIAVEVAYPFETIVDWPVIPQRLVLQCRVTIRRYR